MRKSEYGNVLEISDLHAPWTDKVALKAVYSFSNEVKPTYYMFMGDCLDLSAISAYTTEDLITQYEEPIIYALTEFGKIVDKFHTISPKSKMVWLWGNHDTRLLTFVRKNPAWRGIIDKPLQLLETFGESKHAKKIEIVQMTDPEESYNIGKLCFTHGHYVGKHAAAQHVDAYGHNICFAHTHTMQAYHTVRGGTQPIGGYSVGHLMSKEGRKYLKGRPHRWVTGFGYMEYNKKTGNFTQHLIPIIEGKFIFGGKEYGKT